MSSIVNCISKNWKQSPLNIPPHNSRRTYRVFKLLGRDIRVENNIEKVKHKIKQ